MFAIGVWDFLSSNDNYVVVFDNRKIRFARQMVILATK